MHKRINFFIGCIILLLFVTVSCNTHIKDEPNYLKWMNNPKNGLFVKKLSGDKELVLKYLQPEYLSYNNLKDNKNFKSFDSLVAIYKQSPAFLLTIKNIGEAEDQDIMYEGVGDYAQYSSKVLTASFDMAGNIKLRTNSGQTYSPVSVKMEDTYSLLKQRNFYILFSTTGNELFENCTTWDIEYDDELFNSGIHHFIFDVKNINKKIFLDFVKL